MNAHWREFLGAAGARFNDLGQLTDFGHPGAELAAAAERTVLVPLTHLGLISCAGDDARDFLHNQFTSDINHLKTGQFQHSAWCNAKGRMQASFMVWREADRYQMLLAADLLAPTAKRLGMFILRSKVRLNTEDQTRVLLGVSGPQAGAALAAAGLPVPAENATADFATGSVVHFEAQRYILSLDAAAAPDAWRQLATQATKAAAPVWQWLDIRAGLPLVSLATKEEFVPQMANFERIGGVSFHKGCYPGQEIIARTQYLGKVKRHLFRVTASEALVPGTLLYSSAVPDQSCGMIASAAPGPHGSQVGLAVLMSSATSSTVHLQNLSGSPIECTPVAD